MRQSNQVRDRGAPGCTLGQAPRPRWLALGLAAALQCACSAPAPAPPPPLPPFEVVPVSTYVSKVKSVLTGLPPTDAEVAAVAADQHNLGGLIDQWMARPEFDQKMLAFFELAFQQTQLNPPLFDAQLNGPELIVWHGDDLVNQMRSFTESFARTAQQLIAEGRPFHETLTTRRFMLNTPLMMLLAYLDATPVDDNGQDSDASGAPLSWMIKENPKFNYVWEHKAGPIPFSQSIDPKSPNYLRFYDPTPMVPNPGAPSCTDPTNVATDSGNNFPLWQVLMFLVGNQPWACGATTSQFTQADYDTWRMITVRAPKPGEARTRFFDLPTLRGATELVLDTPRIGFMTTPAFLANYPTNLSNSARVTMNQALIVGLGKSFDDAGVIVPSTQGNDPTMHAQPGTTCYGCHQPLDPMREFFRQTFTVSYHLQMDQAQVNTPASFTMGGVTAKGTGVAALAQIMATHPRFAVAWTQKLCRYANAVSCDEADPEFQRVAGVFAGSGFQWRSLVRELFSSPLVTGAARTQTWQELGGPSAGISQRDHLCTALSNRLTFPDACGLDEPALQYLQYNRNLAMAVPGLGYTRGTEAPLMPRDPNLFSDSAEENLCGWLADQLVDAGQSSRYLSSNSDAAITDFVRTLMGLPDSDQRSPLLRAALARHFDAARAPGGGDGGAPGATPTDALKSTFVLACTAPRTVSQDL